MGDKVNFGQTLSKSSSLPQVIAWLNNFSQKVQSASSRNLIQNVAASGAALSSIANAVANQIPYFTGPTSVGLLNLSSFSLFAGFQTISGSSGTITGSSVLITSTGACVLTLPASPTTGQWLYIKMAAAVQTVTSASSNVVPFNSTTAGTAIFSAGNLTKFASLQYDGTNWQIMAGA